MANTEVPDTQLVQLSGYPSHSKHPAKPSAVLVSQAIYLKKE